MNARRAKRGERGAPTLHRHDYNHEHENELHNENGHRASGAERSERDVPPYTDMNTNMNTNMNANMRTYNAPPSPSYTDAKANRDHLLNTFGQWSFLSSYPLLLGFVTGICLGFFVVLCSFSYSFLCFFFLSG